jgi:hypothetical protein
MSTLSPRVLAICRAHWRTTPSGAPAAGCCGHCPLATPCTTPLSGAFTLERIAAHAEALNRAADALEAA